jgi:DNA transformation protein
MAVPEEFRDSAIENLAPVGDVNARAMFGGYGIFESETMFALVAGSALFFKVDDSNLADYEQAASARYGKMPYFRVPDQVMKDGSALREWARAAIAVGHRTAANKKSKKTR